MINRKTSGSTTCPRCKKLVSVNADTCYNCGYKNPGMFGYGPSVKKIMATLNTSLVSLITYACIVLYVLALAMDPKAILQFRGIFDILSPSTEALFNIGMTGAIPVLRGGMWWTLVTAIYLHGGILHILFNMMWLKQLGTMVVELFGPSRTFLIFTISGVVGFIASTMFGIPITVGASGSIFGMLGALVYYGRKRGGYFGTAIYRQVGTWAIVLFLFGVFMPSVDNFAHAGGFIGGYLSAMLFGFHELMLETKLHRTLALGAVGITIACFALALLF